MMTAARFRSPLARCLVLAGACGALRATDAAAQTGEAPRPLVLVTSRFDAHATLDAIAAQASAQASVPAWKWTKKKLGQGDYSAIAVDAAGNPHVVFGLATKAGRVLTHAWAEGSHWFSEPIDAESEIGYDNSIALGSDGSVHVAYAALAFSGGDWKLMYAHRSAGVWQTEVVEVGGLSNSLAVDADGFANIVHVASGTVSSNGVRYAKQNGSGWDFETVAADGLWFGGTSLLLHDGKVYATYSDSGLPRKLFLATRDAGTWTSQQIDDGLGAAMAFDPDGIVHAVYDCESQSELRHAWLSVSGWQNEALVTSSTLFGESAPAQLQLSGGSATMIEDAAGRLQLAFALSVSKGNASGTGLVSATLQGGVWTPRLVSPKNIGFDNSIAVAPGDLVHLSSGKATGPDTTTVVALRLKGPKLSLSVLPKAAGTITVAATGTVCTGKGSVVVYPGTDLTLTEVPAPGFSFVEWQQSGSGTQDTCNVTMDHNRKVVARFAASP